MALIGSIKIRLSTNTRCVLPPSWPPFCALRAPCVRGVATAKLARNLAFLITALAFLVFAGPARAQQSKRLCIMLNQEWTATGVLMVQGETFTVTASGDMNWFTPIPSRGWRGCPPGANCHTTPDGAACPFQGFLAQGLPCWSLIGRIGIGPVFRVGSSLQNFTASSTGELYLGVNDTPPDYFDNTGDWQAEITTSLPCVPPLAHDIPCVKLYPQKQPNWCWLALAEILMQNSGTGWEHHEQCAQVEVLKKLPAGAVCGAGNDADGDKGFNVKTQTSWDMGGDPVNSLAAYQFTYSAENKPSSVTLFEWISGHVTPTFLMTEIACGERPVGIVWWNGKMGSGSGRHGMAVTGYDWNPAGGGLVLHIFNPGIHGMPGAGPSPANAPVNSGTSPGIVCMYSQTCRISFNDFMSPAPYTLDNVIYGVHKSP